jgi:hypothetical protein
MFDPFIKIELPTQNSKHQLVTEGTVSRLKFRFFSSQQR